MSSRLVVSLTGAEAAAQRVGALPEQLRTALRDTVTRETIALQRHVVEEKLSGQVLNVRTGTLRRSITWSVTETAGGITGAVGTNLRYGLAHEFGKTIQIPEIVPVKAKALHWIARGGGSVFAMRARAHVVILPERSFLRSSLRDRAAAFVAAVRDTLARVLGGGSRAGA